MTVSSRSTVDEDNHFSYFVNPRIMDRALSESSPALDAHEKRTCPGLLRTQSQSLSSASK